MPNAALAVSLLLGLALISCQSTSGQQGSTAPRLPDSARQLIVTVADSWDSSHARMMCFQRNPGRTREAAWKPAAFSTPIPVLLGKHGLAWGRGVLPPPPWGGPVKREGDRRAPAGCFALGKIYGYPAALPEGSHYPYHQVTRWDAWVDDPRNPYYNRHVVVRPDAVPPWFEKQRMRLGDEAYTYLVEIRHNADPPVPGAGSAIFFHIRRGPNRLTSGCTTMARPHLEHMIRWLREDADPHYVLLPRDVYVRLAPVWKLPPLQPAGQ